MPLRSLFRTPPHKTAAHQLYLVAVEQARKAQFYTELKVADTVDGRFDLLVLHVFLILHRLGTKESGQKKLGQALFDLMFADMDVNLREMGVADTGVSSRIKKMVKAFYGRVAAYEVGLSDLTLLKTALRRNLYRGDSVDENILIAMADYVHRQSLVLAKMPQGELQEGRLRFDEPPIL